MQVIRRLGLIVLCGWIWCAPAMAQQRPLTTEDPEAIGAGRVLIEGGFAVSRGRQYPVAGLEGTLWRVPTFGVSVGISAIAELQVDGGLYSRLSISDRREAPLSSLLHIDGESTSDLEDVVVGTKIRVLSESAHRPAFAVRFATKLPVAENESGLGVGTLDFYATLLMGKTVQSVRVVGNGGVGILTDPLAGHSQNNVFVYGVSVARALTERAELVAEIHGRVSSRGLNTPIGTETRGLLNLGARYTTGAFRVDGAGYWGLTSIDTTVGFTAGFTYVFNAFEVY